jgi:hypothetical protein
MTQREAFFEANRLNLYFITTGAITWRVFATSKEAAEKKVRNHLA